MDARTTEALARFRAKLATRAKPVTEDANNGFDDEFDADFDMTMTEHVSVDALIKHVFKKD